MNSLRWEPVIGLEVHVQLNTKSKIFSSAPVTVDADPNQAANLVDLALPGTLPVLNKEAVYKAIRFGLATSANIAPQCRFDRKNYFYPDLPKGYQITQLTEPIVEGGVFEVRVEDGTVRNVELMRAHLEEDAGKSNHEKYPRKTGIDLNRAGTPLLEIVTAPQLTTPSEAAACFRQLHQLVTWLDICDGNLNEGSMRCDANVSVRRQGEARLGERTEIKNLNSFRFVEKALQHEIDRQISILEAGGDVVRETRLYDVERDETRSMRGKEFAHDYRYFPDPDLLPVEISRDMIQTVHSSMPELPAARRHRYIAEHGLDNRTADRLTQEKVISDYFEKAIDVTANAKLTANWVLGYVAAYLNKNDIDIDELGLSGSELGEIVKTVDEGVVSDAIAKQIFEHVVKTGKPVSMALSQLRDALITDEQDVRVLVQTILDENLEQVKEYRNGKTKVLGFLVGQVMSASKGKVDPKTVNRLLTEFLAP